MTAPISVVIATCNRPHQLLATLGRILECVPQPTEVIVHVDANDTASVSALEQAFPKVRVLLSSMRVGPGGGRNRLVAETSQPIVASFDDDSYPLDCDYFARLEKLFAAFPKAGVVAAAISHQGEEVQPHEARCEWVSDFVGCGCGYRRVAFSQTSGYVPLAPAYGMEEVDLSLRLHGLGWGILRSPWLRVRHDTSRQHHEDPAITAATIANLFLLTYLRYPPSRWWIGFGQAAKRVGWLLRHGRRRGILAGFGLVLPLIRKYRNYRSTVPTRVLQSYLRLRQEPIAAGAVRVDEQQQDCASQAIL
jgi:GT2 family glycosyltransferase